MHLSTTLQKKNKRARLKTMGKALIFFVGIALLRMLSLPKKDVRAIKIERAVTAFKGAHPSFAQVELFSAIRTDRPIPAACYAWSAELSLQGGILHLLVDSSNPLNLPTGFQLTVLKHRVDELPTLRTILLTIASTSSTASIVGYVNSDIFPSTGNFFQVVQSLRTWSKIQSKIRTAKPGKQFTSVGSKSSKWLAIAARWDMNKTERSKKLHANGGSDFWLWNRMADMPGLFSGSFEIPEFYLSRPYFDMWVVSMAIQSAKRHVIDVTQPLNMVHVDHERHFESWGERARLQASDVAWNSNYNLAFKTYCVSNNTCYTYQKATGTPCEAPLMLSKDLEVFYRKASIPFACFSQEFNEVRTLNTAEENAFYGNVIV